MLPFSIKTLQLVLFTRVEPEEDDPLLIANL